MRSRCQSWGHGEGEFKMLLSTTSRLTSLLLLGHFKPSKDAGIDFFPPHALNSACRVFQGDLTHREGVELLDLPVHGLQQGEVAGDATLSHSEKRGVVIQEEMELRVLGLSTTSREEKKN